MLGYVGQDNSDTPIRRVLSAESFELFGNMASDGSPVSATYKGWTTSGAKSIFRSYLRGKFPTPYGN